MVFPTALLIFRSIFVEESQFLRWAHLVVSVLATRPSCEDGQGMNYLLLGLYVCLWSEQTGVKFWLVPPFFSRSEYVAESIRVFDDDSRIRG